MKRKIAALLCLCLLCTAAVSCAGKDNWVPAGMQLVENENTDYLLYVPDDWTVDLTTGVTCATASDRSNITVIAFSLNAEDTYITPDEYWCRYAEDCRQTYQNFRYLDAAEDSQPADADAGVKIVLGTIEARKYHVAMTVTGMEYHYTVAIVIRGGYVYMITFTARAENEEAHAEEVDQILTNFAFR